MEVVDYNRITFGTQTYKLHPNRGNKEVVASSLSVPTPPSPPPPTPIKVLTLKINDHKPTSTTDKLHGEVVFIL